MAWSAIHFFLVTPLLVLRFAGRHIVLSAFAAVFLHLLLELAFPAMSLATYDRLGPPRQIFVGILLPYSATAEVLRILGQSLAAVLLVAAYLRYVNPFLMKRLAEPIGLALLVVSDVARYVSDQNYWRRLHLALKSTLEALPHDRNIVVVGHSLGSAIAVDHLRYFPDHFTAHRSVTLITMGSPLRRLLSRFVASRYPPCEELEALLASSLPHFRWFNIYRPLDPIGSSLFPVEGHDLSTRQWRRWLPWTAHTSYWGDPVVFAAIKSACSRPGRRQERRIVTMEDTPFLPLEWPTSRLRRRVAIGLANLSALVVWILGVVLFQASTKPDQPIELLAVVWLAVTVLLAKQLLLPFFRSACGVSKDAELEKTRPSL